MTRTHQHTQELTVASITETVVDSEETPPRLSNTSRLTGSDAPTLHSPSPGRSVLTKPLPVHDEKCDLPDFEVIPPKHSRRTLVLCFDGTGDQFDADNSNIEMLFSMLKKDDRSQQMVYYQSGFGTYTSPTIVSPIIAKLSKTLDLAVAWNLDSHVMSGYEFLMQNYIAGDKICLFGFSRGAYTARALAGMLHKVGLLPASNSQQVPFAYKMYTKADEEGWKQSNAFKKAFSVHVDIEFIGVWDTVNSVGLIPHRLPFTTSNTVVRTFRHALSLDEHRAMFQPNLWNRPTAVEETLGIKLPTAAEVERKLSVKKVDIFKKEKKQKTVDSDQLADSDEVHLSALEKKYSRGPPRPTDVLEVWFAGCHCDVGGGSVPNSAPHALARIPLRWMIRECFKADTGIMFDAECLREIGLEPTTLYPVVLPRPPSLAPGTTRIARAPRGTPPPTSVLPPAAIPSQPGVTVDVHGADGELELGTEEEEDLRDALSPVYDQLKRKRAWWILEVLPTRFRFQRSDNTWTKIFRWNLGRPRVIPHEKTEGFKVHRSVKTRMDALYESKNGKEKRYVPRPRFKVEPIWVD